MWYHSCDTPEKANLKWQKAYECHRGAWSGQGWWGGLWVNFWGDRIVLSYGDGYLDIYTCRNSFEKYMKWVILLYANYNFNKVDFKIIEKSTESLTES